MIGKIGVLLYHIDMRIIAGKYKGKKLAEFELSSTRPTSDLIREALFDKIGLDIAGSVFLDLFAGTGAIGIEALSRNASFCHFVDCEKNAIKIIKQNLSLIGATEINSNVQNKNYEEALKQFTKNNTKFDFVFLDPPYKTDFAEKAINILFESNLLNPDALIVWEHDNSKLEYVQNNFPNSKTKKYGQKFLTYIYSK